jgi:hypothetical protein
LTRRLRFASEGLDNEASHGSANAGWNAPEWPQRYEGASGGNRASRWSAGAGRSTFRFRRRLLGDAPAAPAIVAPAISADQLVGKWGFPTYHEDEDRARVKEAAARFNWPYVINKGPSGGLMMNLADQKELSELVLKAANDRIVTNVDANSFTAIWVDSGQRNGTSVYVRCGKR